MSKVIINEIDKKLEYCVCAQGCGICSGSMIGMGSVADYYQDWLKFPGNYGFTSFREYCYDIDISDDMERLDNFTLLEQSRVIQSTCPKNNV